MKAFRIAKALCWAMLFSSVTVRAESNYDTRLEAVIKFKLGGVSKFHTNPESIEFVRQVNTLLESGSVGTNELIDINKYIDRVYLAGSEADTSCKT